VTPLLQPFLSESLIAVSCHFLPAVILEDNFFDITAFYE